MDIAMLSCNRARITEISIREIKRRTLSKHKLIVLDNGSEDRSQDVLWDLVKEGLIDELHFLEENTGVHYGLNSLLALVTSDVYICTDNDLIPQAPVNGVDWLEKLCALSLRSPGYAAIACRPHVLIGEPPDRFDDSPEVREMSHIGAHLRLMYASIVKRVGGWKKTKSPSRNNEDWHIGGLLTGEGYKVGYARDIRCIHQFGDEKHGEDPWGYPLGVEHGHVERHPPVNAFSWDKVGINWETCR